MVTYVQSETPIRLDLYIIVLLCFIFKRQHYLRTVTQRETFGTRTLIGLGRCV